MALEKHAAEIGQVSIVVAFVKPLMRIVPIGVNFLFAVLDTRFDFHHASTTTKTRRNMRIANNRRSYLSIGLVPSLERERSVMQVRTV